jgi:branched-chain amino acid transport system substrate-binding protein
MRLATAAFVAIVLLGSVARAADTITIGAIYPLGRDDAARLAIETAEDIVNTPHQGLDTLPLGAGQGLPKLAGAKIAVTFADDLSNPSVAEAQALRLVTRDHVVALIGAGQLPETLAATALAERHSIPFLVPDAMDPQITGRGFKWVFRTAPLASDIAGAYAAFIGELRQSGTKIDNVALFFEDSDFGRSAAAVLRDRLKATGFGGDDISYPVEAADLSAPVAQLRDKKPDAVICVSPAADAILLMKTMTAAGYKPPLLIGDRFSDPAFVTAVGNLAQGAIGRSVWSLGKPASPTAVVNDLYEAKSGRDLDHTTAQIMQGFFVLADAINRAGSTEPAAIQKALQQTALTPEQLIVGYNGVKFDATGQNVLASTYLTQLHGKQFVAVWPAAKTEGKLELPFRGSE